MALAIDPATGRLYIYVRAVLEASTGETTEYSYDLMGNLLGVSLPDGTYVQYDIDAAGRRVGKRLLDAGGNVLLERTWIYRDLLRPIAELDASGNVVARYVYEDGSGAGPNDLAQVMTRLGTYPDTRLPYAGRNVPEYMVTFDTAGAASGTYRLVTDHVGSVRLVVDTTDGTVAQRLEYDEFGIVLQDTNPGFQPFGFAGGLYDSATKLVRLGARDYDPVVGRWTAKDPIGFEGGQANLYAYSLGDPSNRRDSSGTASEEDCPRSTTCGTSNCFLSDFSDTPCPTCPDIIVDGWCTYLCSNNRGDTNGTAVILLYSWGGESDPICDINEGVSCGP